MKNKNNLKKFNSCQFPETHEPIEFNNKGGSNIYENRIKKNRFFRTNLFTTTLYLSKKIEIKFNFN